MIESVGVINLSTYLIGALVVILLPGPNSLFVLASAASKGVKSGYRLAAVFRRYTRLSALSNTAVALVFIAFAVRMAFGVV